MKNAPITSVSTYHSRRPHCRMAPKEPVRLTCPRSAAKTPIWHVKELATRTLVFKIANGMFSLSVSNCQSVSTPSWAAWELETLRTVKYAANSAAKNISSDANQTMVPTATKSGRFSRPRRRTCGIGCRALAGLVIEPLTAWVCRATRSLLLYDLPRSPLGTTLQGHDWTSRGRAIGSTHQDRIDRLRRVQ